MIPLPDVPERIEEIPDDETVYVICHTGSRSARAVEYLNRQGHDTVNVRGRQPRMAGGGASGRIRPGVSHWWIDSAGELSRLVDALGDEPEIALDTEFHRERTYHPQLALLQLAWSGDQDRARRRARGRPDAASAR